MANNEKAIIHFGPNVNEDTQKRENSKTPLKIFIGSPQPRRAFKKNRTGKNKKMIIRDMVLFVIFVIICVVVKGLNG